ncbi:MAG TPA: type II toxin-antitoxin system VapC family toxin [Verrucomicrobiota bacterium]|nr:type II toxin-antitoxin system VapC family toxin [Verrucomicrobiota bacterium]
MLTRRRKLTVAERDSALQKLTHLGFEVDGEAPLLALAKLAELAIKHDLSVYDAAYLELATRRQLRLAGKDGPLTAAAKASGIRTSP